MPKYVFACQNEGCHLRFERTLKMGEHPDHPCPSCQDTAPRVLDQEGFAFAFKQAEKPVIGNTGVHKDDFPTADRVVGKDAEKRWESYEGQRKVKEQARAQGGSPALIRHQGKNFIDYEPMSDVGRGARKKLVDRAIEAVRSAKESKVGQ